MQIYGLERGLHNCPYVELPLYVIN